MVKFTCGTCSAVVKKQQAAQHVNKKCIGAKLSCVDCAKEFVGAEFKKHSQCVTEAEKYSKKGATKPGEPKKVENSKPEPATPEPSTVTPTTPKKKKKKSRTGKKTRDAKKRKEATTKVTLLTGNEKGWWKDALLASLEDCNYSAEDKGTMRAKLSSGSLPFRKAKIERFITFQFSSDALQTKARKIFDKAIKLCAEKRNRGGAGAKPTVAAKKAKQPKSHSKVVDSKKNLVKLPKGQKQKVKPEGQKQKVKPAATEESATADKVGPGKKRQLVAGAGAAAGGAKRAKKELAAKSGNEGSLADGKSVNKKDAALAFAGIKAKVTPVMLKAKKGGKVKKGEKFGAGKQRGQNNSRQKAA